MLQPKDVLLVNQDILGIKLFINAHAVNYQDKSLTENVYAHHQKISGMKPQRLAHVHQTLLETTVFHAQLQESGTTEPTLVTAQHQLTSGTETSVSAQLVNMDLIALNAQPQDTGILPAINVFVITPLSGMDKNVFAQPRISFIKEDVPNVQKDIHGKTTNVKHAHVLLKIYKF